jgi:hypothetical protein
MKKLIIFILLLIASISYGQASLLGSGTEGDPYQIWDAQDLDTVRYYPFGAFSYFKLMADIDLDSAKTGQPWVPIGYGTSTNWRNQINGDYYTIKNMQVLREGGSIANSHKLGFIAQYLGQNTAAAKPIVTNVIFDSCTVEVKGTMASTLTMIGIIAGEAAGCALYVYTDPAVDWQRSFGASNVLIKNSSIILGSTFNGYRPEVGIAVGNGSLNALRRVGVENCRLIINQTADSHAYFGALAGKADVIEQCFVDGSTFKLYGYTGTDARIGGLIGQWGKTASIQPSYNNYLKLDTLIYDVNNAQRAFTTYNGQEYYGATGGIGLKWRGYMSIDYFSNLGTGTPYMLFEYFSSYPSINHFYIDTTGISTLTLYDSTTQPDSVRTDTMNVAEMAIQGTFTELNFDSTWYMSGGSPRLQWELGFGNLAISNPAGLYQELYVMGDSVTIAWTSTTDDSSYIYIEDVLVDSSSSPYYWISDTSDTLEAKVWNIEDNTLLDSANFFVYDTIYSSLTIIGTLGDSLTFESIGIDSVAYYYSLDSALWVWIGKVMVMENGFADTTIFYMEPYDFGSPQDTVYVRVKEIATVELFLTGESPVIDTSYYGKSSITCNYWGLTAPGQATNLVDASCGWSSGGTQQWITYYPPIWNHGAQDWDINRTVVENPTYGPDCCPPGTVYDISCWAPFCNGNEWDNLYTPDSVFFAGRYYFIPNGASDSVHVFDPLNDTTYAFFQIDSVSNASYQTYQYFYAYTDAVSGNSYLMFTTDELVGTGSVLGMSTAVGSLPVDKDKALSEDVTIISSLSYVRDYFRGYYPKMLR